MEADWASTLELKLILGLQKISNSLGVLGSCSDIIHVDSNILIGVAIPAHPDVRLSLGWGESHVPEAIGKVFMPMEARSPEAIECLEDDDSVSFQLTNSGPAIMKTFSWVSASR